LRGEADLVLDLDLDLDLDLETDRSNDLLHKTDSYHFMVKKKNLQSRMPLKKKTHTPPVPPRTPAPAPAPTTAPAP
jgi:hypothetical protein